MFDVTTEILELGDTYVKARRTLVSPGEEVEQSYKETFGYTFEEFEKILQHIEKGITGAHGLSVTHNVEENHVVFTVTAPR